MMKSAVMLTAAALGSSAIAANVVSMNIVRNPASSGLSRRHLSTRATISESLINNVTGGSYMATVSVGTPAQKLDLVIDTGSSDVWLLDSNADLCTNEEAEAYYGGCETTFDSSKSSTFKVVDAGGFDIQYQDLSGSSGDYITDDFTIGGATIKNLEMGLANSTTVPTGLMGIGYDTNEAAESIYPNIIDEMFSQGLINTKAYSLYLDDLQSSTGSIIFGGLDADKYHGDLIALPIAPDQTEIGTDVYAEFTVALTYFGYTDGNGKTANLSLGGAQAVILDSGTTITYIPDDLAQSLFESIGAVDDTANSGNVYVDCTLRTSSSSMTFNYGFGDSNTVIKVPVSEVVFDLDGIFALPDGTVLPTLPFSDSDACGLGIQSASGGPNLLGDTFLRSAYVVYDLSNNQIALAQTNFNSTSSSIVEFQASATSIPNVSGIASSVSVTATVTGAVGGGSGGKTSGTASGTKSTSTSTSTASSSKSASVASVPAFDISRLAVLGVSGFFALVGSSWMLR